MHAWDVLQCVLGQGCPGQPCRAARQVCTGLPPSTSWDRSRERSTLGFSPAGRLAARRFRGVLGLRLGCVPLNHGVHLHCRIRCRLLVVQAAAVRHRLFKESKNAQHLFPQLHEGEGDPLSFRAPSSSSSSLSLESPLQSKWSTLEGSHPLVAALV